MKIEEEEGKMKRERLAGDGWDLRWEIKGKGGRG